LLIVFVKDPFLWKINAEIAERKINKIINEIINNKYNKIDNPEHEM
jgi:Txe/YoeB family toxin of Txe-Axe toxin-antitoxin module